MVDNVTIENFGEQWTRYPDSSGFFGSLDLFKDFIAPVSSDIFKSAKVVDIGAGTGRFSLSLLEAGAKEVVVLEPSEAIEVAKEKLEKFKDKVTFLNLTGCSLPKEQQLDSAISLGVIHHIPEPAQVIKAVYDALKPGGKFIVWLYGKENNRLYLAFLLPFRGLARFLPAWGKHCLSWGLNHLLSVYLLLCKYSPVKLPLKNYMLSIIAPLSLAKRRLVIYDQLNPRYAKYYTKKEANNLMKQAPFDVELYHRRGYSWVVVGTKPKVDL